MCAAALLCGWLEADLSGSCYALRHLVFVESLAVFEQYRASLMLHAGCLLASDGENETTKKWRRNPRLDEVPLESA